MPRNEPGDATASLNRELQNFEAIANKILPEPGEVPHLRGIDVWGGTRPLNGAVGGDHIIYVDFKQRCDLDARIAEASAANNSAVVEGLLRCRHRAGIVVLDVSGHQMTDALMAAMVHQAFLLGALYELDRFGQITTRLFENLNTRLYNSSGAHKFVSLLYGEVSEQGTFRFLSAGQPLPRVFSHQYDRFMDVQPDRRRSFPPIGIQPSLNVIDRRTNESPFGFKKQYEVNEWTLLGAGDLLLLHTDGLSEHGDDRYFPTRVEKRLRQVKNLTSQEIYEAIYTDLLQFAPPDDDITLVVVKREL
ncbi:MAG: PP2C family protein-serine/threonine phosphatase [Acidobacteriota bacterium]|nr:PP2C family protein-serine/threonine phosphatase [Acidobacteriota bacterium]